MKTIERAARSVGTDPTGLGTHSGRRTVITALYADGGVDLADIARHVGHIDTATTAEYVRSLGNRPVDTARRAAELLDPSLSTGPTDLLAPHPRSITSDTLRDMGDVSIRELRNHGGEVVDRVARGERVTVTRRGKQVAELRPLRSSAVAIEELVRRRAHLPLVDPAELRRDLDVVIDPSL